MFGRSMNRYRNREMKVLKDELPSPNRRDLITHDRDAIHRTILANQRTFLSYLRTALTFFVAGISFVKFFDHLLIEIVGWAFIPIGIATFVIGFHRYNKLRVRLTRMTTPLKHPMR
jgi:putative membrane protein